MIAALNDIGQARLDRNGSRVDERVKDVKARCHNGLSMILERWREGDRAASEAEKLGEDLNEIARPLRDELLVRQGAFRELLRKGIPKEIELRVDLAAREAQIDIASFLKRKYGNYHWATLRASVRKNGAFVGARKVSLPDDLTLRFEEPLAVVWSKEILAVLRRETRRIGEDYVRLVGEIVKWARGQQARVKPQLVEALHADLKSQTNELASVGREAIDELRESVRTGPYSAVEDEVRKQCQRFVNEKKDAGTGVKNRILELLGEELARHVVDAARPAARKVLEKRFRIVEREVTEALERIPDPIAAAVNAIVNAHEVSIRRSDAKRRAAVLATGERLLAALPRTDGVP